MTEDPCQKERQALEDAKKRLQDQQGNPLRWGDESTEESAEKFDTILSELEIEVAQREKALRDCEASNKQQKSPA